MTIRENVMAVFHHEKPDRIPWFTYDIPYPMLPRGSWERELRNMGMGIIVLTGFHPTGDIYSKEMRNVEVELRPVEENGRSMLTTIYHTPVGTISKKEDLHISPPNPWIVEYPIKRIQDYEVAEFIIRNTIYNPNYDSFAWIDKHVGDDGFVRAHTTYSPYQNLLIKYMGVERLAFDLHEHTAEVEHLLKTLEVKYYELVNIIANSPAEIVGIDGNITGTITSPNLFEKYIIPIYRNASDILHKKNKVVQVHMDGMLKSLKDLIPESGLDVIEAFTPPPLGDLSVSEARAAWGDKMIIEANFPESICTWQVNDIKKYTMNLLNDIAPGDGFILSVTEDIPYREPNDLLEKCLRAVTEIIAEHGKYPIRGTATGA
jgi:hypothetical protein